MNNILKATDDLVVVLHRTGDLIDLLLETSNQKEAHLNSGEISGLNEVLLKEEDIVSELNDIEEDRRNCSVALAVAADIADKDTTLRELCEAIQDPDCKLKLNTAREELAEKMERLTQQNSLVWDMLQFKVNYTDYLINLLSIPQTSVVSYNGQGDKEDEGSKMNLMDVRV